jgi:choice-of-anchor B domain-containing protein
MSRFLLLVLLAPLAAHAQAENLTLVGHLDPRPEGYADVWGYVGADGREYALINVRSGGGLSVIDVTDDVPVEMEFIPGSGSGSDVEAYGDYAYVSDDFGPTLIVGLSDPTDPEPVNAFGDGVHTLTVAGDYLYTNGNGGVRIWSLADPVNPAFVGQYNPHYVHDILVRGDTMYTAGIRGDGIDIVDLSDRANPTLISRFNYPGSGAHNFCSDPSGSYLYVGDEVGTGQWTRIFDVRDPHDVEQVGEIIVDPESTVHNCHVKDGLLYLAHYDRGAWVFDISDPVNPVQVAFYDGGLPSFPSGLDVAWSFYPHLPSGKLLVSDMLSGLHVLRLTGTVASEPDPEVAGGLTLAPPFPNPARGAAALRFSLGAPADVRLAVLDAMGREVAVLVDGPLPAGAHEASLRAGSLPAGVYLARLEADGRAVTRRVTLLR